MAFLKFARASVTKPSITMADWEVGVRAKALAGGMQKNASTVIHQFDPNQYLLSHCTIVASVDTEQSGEPLGQQLVDGFQIDRRYSDYLVTPESSQFINNNYDCWERNLLLASFRTFIGAENYVEHLQIPELSKGKIVDVAARDIGDSVYIDILVATNRKHGPLITAVQSGQLQTLSMGCQVTFTICTKCGNRAEDETQLCTHIRHMKGNTFLDGTGKSRKIAELCGHVQEEPGSVKFIEASWVANPAFTGAVLRNILSPEETASLNLGNKVQIAFSETPRIATPGMMNRAAKSIWTHMGPKTAQFDFEDEDESKSESLANDDKDPMDKAVDDMAEYIREKAIEKIREEMSKEVPPRADLDEDRNETLVKEAVLRSSHWRKLAKVVLSKTKNPAFAKRVVLGLLLYRQGGWKAVQAASFSGTDILALSRFLDLFNGTPKIAGEARIYRTVVAVGGLSAYGNEESYLSACRRAMGRKITGTEKDALMTKGRLYDLGS